jgi:hypothetical protein
VNEWRLKVGIKGDGSRTCEDARSLNSSQGRGHNMSKICPTRGP